MRLHGERRGCGMGAADAAAQRDKGGTVPLRVFVSYAHDDAAHLERVRDFWLFLRASGIDARLDLPATEERQDWAQDAGRTGRRSC